VRKKIQKNRGNFSYGIPLHALSFQQSR
jgi:hypothetical protein